MNNLSEALGPLFENENVQEQLKKQGSLTLEEVRERIAANDAKQQAATYKTIQNDKAKQFLKFSVWGGDQERNFEFSQWKPEIQTNIKLAKELKDAAKILTHRILQGEYPNGRVLVTGDAGSGKTAMVLAMLNAIKSQSDKTVMFVNVAELAGDIHTFNDDRIAERVRIIKTLMKKVDVLVIDDFGSEVMGKANTYASNPLQMFYYEIAEARMVAKDGYHTFTTIVTTNNTVPELAQMFEPKIISRIITKDKSGQLNFRGLEDVR